MRPSGRNSNPILPVAVEAHTVAGWEEDMPVQAEGPMGTVNVGVWDPQGTHNRTLPL